MKLSKGRVIVCAALSMILGIGLVAPTQAALFGLWKSKKKASIVARQSLVVFPFDQADATRVPPVFGEYVASDIRYVLSESDRFCIVLYKDRLPPIERGIADNELRPKEDTAPPFSEEKEKALKLARFLATDLYLVGSVDDFQVDTTKKVAVVTLSAQLVDAKTGKLIRTLLVTGRSPETATTAQEDELRDLAKGDAVTKLSAEILAPAKKAVEGAPGATPAPPAATGETANPAGEKTPEQPKDKAAETAVK